LQATEPKTLKKHRVTKEPASFQQVLKISKASILLNSEYEKAVTNQLVREEKNETDYQRGENTMPLVFGENNNFIGIFKGEYVLQYRPNDNIFPKVKFLVDGKMTDVKNIREFLPAQTHATNQNTDREILWRKVYLKNVKKLTLQGVTYKIIE
jgi:hypothetical protein